MVTSRLPFLAVRAHEMRAMAGHCPTIVQRPDNRDAVLLQVPEKQRLIDKATVYVVYMHNVWFNLLHLGQKLSGLISGT